MGTINSSLSQSFSLLFLFLSLPLLQTLSTPPPSPSFSLLKEWERKRERERESKSKREKKKKMGEMKRKKRQGRAILINGFRTISQLSPFYSLVSYPFSLSLSLSLSPLMCIMSISKAQQVTLPILSKASVRPNFFHSLQLNTTLRKWVQSKLANKKQVGKHRIIPYCEFFPYCKFQPFVYVEIGQHRKVHNFDSLYEYYSTLFYCEFLL